MQAFQLAAHSDLPVGLKTSPFHPELQIYDVSNTFWGLGLLGIYNSGNGHNKHFQPVNTEILYSTWELLISSTQYWLEDSSYKQTLSNLLLLSSRKLSTIVSQINGVLSCSIGTAETGLLQFLKVVLYLPLLSRPVFMGETLILSLHIRTDDFSCQPLSVFPWRDLPTLADLHEQTTYCTKSQPPAFTLAWGLIHKEADAKFPLSCRSLF